MEESFKATNDIIQSAAAEAESIPRNTALTSPVPVHRALPNNSNNTNTNTITASIPNLLLTNPLPPAILNAIQQHGMLYRPGAPIHPDHRTRHDPGIQTHDVLLPWQLERHRNWPGNRQLQQVICADPSLSSTQMLAHLMEHLPYVRLFTLPAVDPANLGRAMPYYLVQQYHVREELQNIIAELKRERASVMEQTVAMKQVPITVTEQQMTTAEAPVIGQKVTTVEVPVIQPEVMTVEAPVTGQKVTTVKPPVIAPKATTVEAPVIQPEVTTVEAPVIQPEVTTVEAPVIQPEVTTATATAAQPRNDKPPSNTNKPVKLPTFKLKQASIKFKRPNINTPADLLELYCNPMFSFAFPERVAKKRNLKRTGIVEQEPATKRPKAVPPVSTKSSGPSFSITIPRRARIKSKQPRRRKKRQHPSTPDSTDHPSRLPKGVTQRPSGKWQAQVYFAGASRYVGVYNNSHQANTAYAAFKAYLKPYKEDALNEELSRSHLHVLLEEARKCASKEVGLEDEFSSDS